MVPTYEAPRVLQCPSTKKHTKQTNKQKKSSGQFENPTRACSGMQCSHRAALRLQTAGPPALFNHERSSRRASSPRALLVYLVADAQLCLLAQHAAHLLVARCAQAQLLLQGTALST